MQHKDQHSLRHAKVRARWGTRGALLLLGAALFAGGMGYVGWSNRPLPPLRYPARALPEGNGYSRLVETLNRITPLPRVTPLRRPMEAPLADLRAAVAADVEDLTEIRRLLRQPIVRPHLARFPSARCHEACLLLTAQSRLAMEAGRTAEATELALDAIALGAVVGREVEYLFGFSWSVPAVEAVRGYLPRLSAAEARRAGHRVEQLTDCFPAWKDCAEQIRLETLLQARVALSDPRRFGQVMNLEQGDTPWGALRDRALLTLYPRAAGYQDLERWYDSFCAEAAQPYPSRRHRRFPRGWFASRVQHGIPTDEMPEYHRARLELLRLQLALHEYRLRHGRYPAGLRALTPECLSTLPADPFDGQPYRYRLQEGGYQLYSVGPNGYDEGGKPIADDGQPFRNAMPTRTGVGDLVVERRE